MNLSLCQFEIGLTDFYIRVFVLLGDIRQRVQQLRPKFVVTDEARLVRVRDAVQDLDFMQEVLIAGKAENCTTINDFLLDDGTGMSYTFLCKQLTYTWYRISNVINATL